MKTEDYIINSAKTFKDREIGIDAKTTDLLHCVVGINTEVGELLQAINIDHNQDPINTKEEVGDIAWYAANLARLINFTPPVLGEIKLLEIGPSTHVNLLVVRSSELMDHFKRGIYYFKGLDEAVIKEKLNSIFILLYGFCNAMEISIEDCYQTNIDKLAKRYPGNFFTPEAALNRDLDAEREILEKGGDL